MTATVDWCEENYVHTPFIAELWNTASSVPMVLAGLWGLYKARLARLEPRLQLCYVRHGSDGQSGLRWDALLRLAAYALADWSGLVCISRDADAHRTGAAIRARHADDSAPPLPLVCR